LEDKNCQVLWQKDYSSDYGNSASRFDRGLPGLVLGKDPIAVIELSDDLKSAQANTDSKRAGFLGWKR
jgi:hypothetical protein